MAHEWAKERKLNTERYPARWDDLEHPDAIIAINKWGKEYNKNAGPIRNRQMIVEGKPDLVIAFPGGNGTNNMISQAILYKINIIKVKIKK